MRLAAVAVAATIMTNHLAAFADQEVDPATEVPIAVEAGRKTVHENGRLTLADHLVVNRHATRLNSRHAGTLGSQWR
jgi:hypothetical protein